MRTILDICQHLQKLDHYAEKVFITALTSRHIPNSIERKLPSLPVKLGGMRFVIFADVAKTEYPNSRNITKSLKKLHLEQSTEYNIIREELAKLKNNIRKASKFDNRFSNQQNSFKRN